MSTMRNFLLIASVLAVILAAPLFLVFQLHSGPRRPVATELDDLTGNVAPLLASLPHVVDVRQTGPAFPTVRIIHLLDWHLIPAELHQLDAGNRGQSYAEHQAEVEQVQLEMELLLHRLAFQHGVKEILVEGFTAECGKGWQARIDLLRTRGSFGTSISAWAT